MMTTVPKMTWFRSFAIFLKSILYPIMKSRRYMPKVSSNLKRSLSIVDPKSPNAERIRPKNREENIHGILRYFCRIYPKLSEML